MSERLIKRIGEKGDYQYRPNHETRETFISYAEIMKKLYELEQADKKRRIAPDCKKCIYRSSLPLSYPCIACMVQILSEIKTYDRNSNYIEAGNYFKQEAKEDADDSSV